MSAKHSSLAERILDVARRADDSTFLRLLGVDGVEVALSYTGVLQQAALWTRIYKDRGLKPRQRVVVLVSSSIDGYAAFLGAIVGGLVPAMLPPPSPKLPEARFTEIVAALLPAARPDAIVIGSELKGAVWSADGLMVIPTQAAALAPLPDSFAMEGGSGGDDIAFLQYSSGTTGLRKGVMISHAACLEQIDLYGAAIGLRPDDSIVSWLPLYHDMGLVACWMLPLLTGTPVTAMSPFDWVAQPSMLTRAIRDYRPSLCWQPNFAYLHLVRSVPDADLGRDDLSSIRAFINCSEPVRHAAHTAFLTKFARFGARPDQIGTCYAMAEATFAVTSSRLGEPPVLASVDATRLGSEPSVVPGPTPLVSSGRAIAGVTVRIADESGRSLAESTVGEIRVASSMLTAGYLENPEATSAALGGGELRTGDIGFMQDGELFVLGRADDMIIVAGRNLLPQDLEAVVDSVPGVVPGRSVAFGVDDDKDGTSHVVVVAETIAGEDRPALARWISSELLAQLDVAPRAVHAVDRGWLLKSTSGKISRRLNRQRYLSELAARASGPARAEPAADGSLVAFVRAAVTVALDRDCPDDDDSLILSGQLDSLALTRLLLALGERFGDRLPLPNVVGFHRFDSVDAICRLLEEVEQGAIASSRQTGASPRGDKLASFAGATGRFDLLILGSSTAYTIPGKLEAAAGISAFNLAIDMAMIADIYCVMRFALDRQDRVRRIIVGLDVFAFRPKDVTVIDPRSIGFPDLVKYLAPDDRAALAALGEAGEREFQRLRINLQRLIGWNPGLRYSFDGEHGDLIGDDAGVQPSGLRPDVIEQNRHAMAVAYGGFDRICPKQSEYLRDMARVATAAAIRIDFVIMPIHRALGDFLAEKTTYPARKAEVLDLIRPLVSETVRLHDLSTPAAFGGDEEDFSDTYHLDRQNGARLLRYVLAR